MTNWRKHIKNNIWIILGGLALLLRIVFKAYPIFAEQVYARGFFKLIRLFFDNTTALLPFPMYYVFWIVIVVWIVFKIVLFIKTKYTIKERIIQSIQGVFSFLGALLFFFLVLWGYNYTRVSVEQELGLDLQPLGLEYVKSATIRTTDELILLRQQIENADTTALDRDFLSKNLNQQMRQNLEDVLNRYGYPTTGRVRIRHLKPKGVLLRINTAGVYFPFVGEGNIDAGLHPLQLPYTIAHEMAHGYGFGDEGTCNFWAYLACMESDDAFIQYAGLLTYWRYIAGEYKRRVAPEVYTDFRASILTRGIYNDLDAIYKNAEQYPSIFPTVRNMTYDTYLKLQGIEDGVENYNRVVVLVEAFLD